MYISVYHHQLNSIASSAAFVQSLLKISLSINQLTLDGRMVLNGQREVVACASDDLHCLAMRHVAQPKPVHIENLIANFQQAICKVKNRTELMAHYFLLIPYISTFEARLQRPPMGPGQCGLSIQVVSETRLILARFHTCTVVPEYRSYTPGGC